MKEPNAKPVGQVHCCDRVFQTADDATRHEHAHLVVKSYETLLAINVQWDEKRLPGDFFILPYELTQLLNELLFSSAALMQKSSDNRELL